MKLIHTAAALSAFSLLLVPAFGQAPGRFNTPTNHGTPSANTNNEGSMSKPGSTAITPAVPGSTAMKGANTTIATNCQGMMNQAMPMMNAMGNGTRKSEAMREMDMARTAMAQKDEAMCRTHMRTAMNGMK